MAKTTAPAANMSRVSKAFSSIPAWSLTIGFTLTLVVQLISIVWIVGGQGDFGLLSWTQRGGLLGVLALCGLVTIPFVAGPLRRRVLADWETFEPAFVRVLFDGFMIGSLTYVVLFRPFTRTSFLFFWSVFGTAVAVGLWWGPRLTSRCPRSLLRLTDVIIFNVCLAVLLTEVGLRIYDNFFPSQVLARSEKVRESISRNRLTPGSEHVGSIVNSRGFVDTEPRSTSARRLVVSVGDSMSVGVVPHPFHYTTVAERGLPETEIYNVGVPGVGPSEYRLLLSEEGLYLDPDLILVALFAGNDIAEAGRGSRRTGIISSWYDRSSLLLFILAERLPRIASEGAFSDLDPVKQTAVALSKADHLRARPWLQDPLMESPTFSRDSYLEIERRRARRICQPGREDTYHEIFRDLDLLLNLAGEIPLAVVIIPDEFQVEDWLWSTMKDGWRVGDNLDRDQPQRILTNFLGSAGVPTLDLLPIFRNHPEMEDGKRHLYHLFDTHLNARGNEVAGQALAEFLAELLE